MHGIMLKRLGYNTYILEQSLSLVREGQAAGITAGPHLQAFLKHYDPFNTPWFSFSPNVKVLDKAYRIRIHRD